jgi:hypothetical protein
VRGAAPLIYSLSRRPCEAEAVACACTRRRRLVTKRSAGGLGVPPPDDAPNQPNVSSCRGSRGDWTGGYRGMDPAGGAGVGVVWVRVRGCIDVGA